MSFVIVAPDVLGTAVTNLTRLGSTLSAVSAAAEAQTTVLVAAAQDEVSATIATLFSRSGQEFQGVSARAPHR